MTDINQLARYVSVLTKTVPCRNSVKVLVSVFISLIHGLLKICFPRNATVVVEDLEVTIKGRIQDRKILVDPRERFVRKVDVEGGVTRFRSPRRVYWRQFGWCDSEVFLNRPENTQSGIVVCL